MDVKNTLIPNQISYVNSSLLRPKDFERLLSIDFELPCFVCLTNYNDVAPLFEWMGLKKIASDYNANSTLTNHIYYGFLDKEKLKTLLENKYYTNFKRDFIEQFIKEPDDRFSLR